MYGLIDVGMITAVVLNTHFLFCHHEIVSSVDIYSVLSKVLIVIFALKVQGCVCLLLNVIFIRLLFFLLHLLG